MEQETNRDGKLTAGQVQELLSGCEGWTLNSPKQEISKVFRFASFPRAVLFVNAVAHLAERDDHHPDILIQYDRVTLTLSTHSVHGLSEKDFALARRIEGNLIF